MGQFHITTLRRRLAARVYRACPMDGTRAGLAVAVAALAVSATVVALGGAGATAAPATPAPRPAPRWNLVGLGDSIPAADNCAGCDSFVDLYGRHVGTDTGADVTVTNLGVGGWTSQDLLDSLSADGPAADAVRDADIVTVTIGANDFNAGLGDYLGGECGGTDGLACFDPQLARLRDNLAAILERIRSVRAGRPTAVRVTGYWNVFVDGDTAMQLYGTAFLRDSAALTRRADAVIASVAQQQGVDYVDLLVAFKGPAGGGDPTPLLSSDGDHPSQAGHARIADVLADDGYAPLELSV